MKKKRVKAGTSKASAQERRKLFVEAMIANGGNQTQAAIVAGFPEASAHVRGAELVKDRKVLDMLEKRRAEALEKAKLSADEVMASLARTLRFDPRKLYKPDGSLKAVHELDADTADALAGVEVVEMAGGLKIDGKEGASHVPMYTKKVKWLDKNSAREQGMKHFGLYEKDNAQRPVLPERVLLEFVETKRR